MLKDKINKGELKAFLKRNSNQEEIMVHYTDRDGKWVYPVYNPFYKGNRWISFKEVLQELVVDLFDVKEEAYLSTNTDFFRIK